MHAQVSAGALPKAPAVPGLASSPFNAPPLRPGSLPRSGAAHKLIKASASTEQETAGSTAALQRGVGLGLGLALSACVAVAPVVAAPDAIQELQKIAGNTTLGQTFQKASSGQNLIPDVPNIPSGQGPSIGESLKEAFTTSPAQVAGKGKGKSAAPTDLIRNRFNLSAGIGGGAVLLLASSVLAAPAVSSSSKDAPKAAARGAKSQARKLSGSQPLKAAKQLGGQVRSKGTQPISKQAKSSKPSFGSQLSRVKSAGTSKVGGTARQVQQQAAPSNAIKPAAGLAAAGLVVGGLLFAVLSGNNTPVPSLGGGGTGSPASQQKGDAVGSAAPKEEAAAHESRGGVVAAPPQTAQGSTFDLSSASLSPAPASLFDLSLGSSAGPNSEPLNLRPSVDQVDAPKPGGIPVFPPKGTSQQDIGSSAAPEEEAGVQKSIVKPGGRSEGAGEER